MSLRRKFSGFYHWVLNHLRKIAIVFAVLVAVFVVLPNIALRIPFVQEKIGSQVAHLLQKELSSEVRIKGISWGIGRLLELDGVVFYDRANKPMVSGERLILSINVWELIKTGNLKFSSARLFGGDVNIYRTAKDKPLNIQYAIDILAKPSDTPSQKVIDFNTILLRGCRIAYTEIDKPTYELNEVSIKARLLNIKGDKISGSLDNLSFVDNRGFVLKKLSGKLLLNKEKVSITNAVMHLKNTRLEMPLLKLQILKNKPPALRSLKINPSEIYLNDFAGFIPALSKMDEPVKINLEVVPGRDEELQIKHLALYGQGMIEVDAHGLLTHHADGVYIPQLSVDRFFVTDKALETALLFSPHLVNEEAVVMAQRIRQLEFKGIAGYSPHEYKLQGTLTTPQGALLTDITADIQPKPYELHAVKGSIKSESFNFEPFFGLKKTLGKGVFDIRFDLSHPKGGAFDLSNLKGYLSAEIPLITCNTEAYRHLLVNFSAESAGHYIASADIENEHVKGFVDATFNRGKNLNDFHSVDMKMDIDHIDLKILGMSPDWGQNSASLAGTVSLHGKDINYASADMHMKELILFRGKTKIDLSDSHLSLQGDITDRTATITTPYIDASLTGAYKIKDIGEHLKYLTYAYLPALSPIKDKPRNLSTEVRAGFSVKVKKWDNAVADLLDIPLKVYEPIDINGEYNSLSQFLNIGIRSTKVRYGVNEISNLNGSVLAHESEAKVWLSGSVMTPDSVRFNHASILARAAEDKVDVNIDLGKGTDSLPNGNVRLNALLKRDLYHTAQAGAGGLQGIINVAPSDIRLDGTAWTLSPSHIYVSPKGVYVDHLNLVSDDKYIKINGALTHNPLDKMEVDLNKIALIYILDVAKVDFDMLDTKLSGKVLIRDIFNKPDITADIHGEDFKVNGIIAGDVDIKGRWDQAGKKIMLDGDVDDPLGGKVHVNGYIKPVDNAGLSLNFDADKFRLDFLSGFVDTFSHGMGGKATGKARLFGLFENGVTIEGDPYIQDGYFSVKHLNTTYHFSDTLHFTPTLMSFENINMKDSEGNTAIFDGRITHDHFGNFVLDLDMKNLSNLLAYNVGVNERFPVTGRIYASGDASLKGPVEKMDLRLKMKTEKRTDVKLDFNSPSINADHRFITFTNLSSPTKAESAPADTSIIDKLKALQATTEDEFNIYMDLMVTPDAQVSMVIDPVSKDGIKARTNGNIKINIPTLGDATMYGTLNVDTGTYNFSFEQLSHKTFKIKEGGKVMFRGDQNNIFLDLSAVYSLTANISDLDDHLSADVRRTNVPVNCVLNVSGQIAKPTVKLNIELPGSDTELERRVRSLINTDEMMAKQVIYLLVLGKFYTSDRNTGNSFNNNLSSGWASVASSTLSEQLSYLLGGLSENWSIGTSIKTKNTSFDDTDIELLLSGSLLNNRLLFNGNFGYRDNPYLRNTYIGEFDLEYKLDEGGVWRLKAYNHYNNMYQYLRQSLTTQGVGILYRKDFDTFSELFRSSRKRTPRRPVFRTDSIKTIKPPLR
ncbi:translocation/assembly module TamB domain-containing protein [Porphyromonas pogonae]|uniref:translocation/assembly module TamB domain-containing protein n=1 Tax=Porphyromonas pogonae TaxID=867595 RepID=UPI002E7691CB|nr:translocation/assembly module TamB domain-containing protein [Porphyromonas pogonae]